VEKPARGSVSSGLVAAPLYALPRTMDVFLHEAPAQRGERYITTALAAFARAGGMIRAVRLTRRIEVTTAADVAAWPGRL